MNEQARKAKTDLGTIQQDIMSKTQTYDSRIQGIREQGQRQIAHQYQTFDLWTDICHNDQEMNTKKVVDKGTLQKRKERAIRSTTNEFIEEHKAGKLAKDTTAIDVMNKNEDARKKFLNNEHRRHAAKSQAC